MQHPDPTPSPESVGRFAMVPEALCFDSTLSLASRTLYVILLQHGSTPASCSPSRARLASLLGRSESTVDRALTELERAGWVTKLYRAYYVNMTRRSLS